MDRHDPEGRVAIVMDEWGTWYDVEPGTNPGHFYQQNTIRDAVVAGLSLNIFNSHSQRLKIANIAQVANVLQSMVLTHERNESLRGRLTGRKRTMATWLLRERKSGQVPPSLNTPMAARLRVFHIGAARRGHSTTNSDEI